MATFILDASVAISWCFPGDPTENTSYGRRILKELASNDAIVPEIWPFEIANGIFVSHNKRKRINEQQITESRCTKVAANWNSIFSAGVYSASE